VRRMKTMNPIEEEMTEEYDPVEEAAWEAELQKEGRELMEFITHQFCLHQAEKIAAWDHERIEDLVEAIADLKWFCSKIGAEPEAYISMAELPSEELPPWSGKITTAIWAVDKRGMALVGEEAQQIMPLSRLLELEEES